MDEFLMGTKNYDADWFLKYDLSYDHAARILKEWGFNFILTQNKLLPMADSAINSEATPDQQMKFASYDDLKFREVLDREGLGYWPTLCMFFNPFVLENDPSLCPVDGVGKTMEKVDWYVGINPSRSDYVESQMEALARVVNQFHPDGIFLSFIRWPGFWELWMPHHTRLDFSEYSYDQYTLTRFQKDTGVHLPTLNPKEAAAWIDENVRQSWTEWKCKVITDVVRQLRTEVVRIKPDIQVMINTLPFGKGDYENARDLTFGQNLETLADEVDIFEVMTYHQVLKRPVEWIAEIGREVKEGTRKKTVCTLQVEPLYLDGFHASETRSSSLEATEFAEAVNIVEQADLDGVVVFVWSDLLKHALINKDKDRIIALSTAVKNRAVKNDWILS